MRRRNGNYVVCVRVCVPFHIVSSRSSIPICTADIDSITARRYRLETTDPMTMTVRINADIIDVTY